MSHATAGPCDAGIAATTSPGGGTPPAAAAQRATLAATVLGSSLAFIDGSVVNVALPALAADLGVGPADLGWAVNAYLLPLGALTLFGGAAGDRYGRRRFFLAGIAIFLIASVVCAVAPAYSVFLSGRAAQGVGAALLMPSSLAILGSAFAGVARGRAIGTWAAAGAIAGALGPLVGGWLVDVAGWRFIFAINLPVGLAAAWLAWRHVAENAGPSTPGPLDWPGALTVTLGLGLVTWSLSAASEPATSALLVACAAVAGVAFLVAFFRIEAHAGSMALVPPALFASRAALGLTVFTFMLYGALGALFVLLPFALVRGAGWSAVSAGAALLPLPLVIGIGSRAMGALAARVGNRWPLTVGAAVVSVGFCLFLRVEIGAVDYWRDVFPATLVVALGMALCVAPLTSAVMASVDAAHAGAASGFNSAVARIGGLLATALLGFVFTAAGSGEAMSGGFRVTAAVSAVCAALACAAVALLLDDAGAGKRRSAAS